MRPSAADLRRLLRVYLVTDPSMGLPRSLEEIVGKAVEAGVRCVQLRDKGASTGDLAVRARSLLSITRPSGAVLVVDDDVRAAVEAGADGVHLGQDDTPAATARRILGPGMLMGVSVRTAGEARAAEDAGADYLAANLVFHTGTKGGLGEPLGLEGVAELRRASTLPLVAIGGMNASNAAGVVAAGADGIAVVSAIMTAPDVASACRELLGCLSQVEET